MSRLLPPDHRHNSIRVGVQQHEDSHRGHPRNGVARHLEWNDPIRRRAHLIETDSICSKHRSKTLIELRLVRPLFLEPPLALLFRQTGTVTAILSLLEILRELAITLGHLLLAKLVALLLLLQHKQQVFLPVAFQTPRNLLLIRLHPAISEQPVRQEKKTPPKPYLTSILILMSCTPTGDAVCVEGLK